MLEKIIEEIARELRKRVDDVDLIMDNSRQGRVLSKQSIMNVHNGDFEKASLKLKGASLHLVTVGKVLERHPEFKSYNEVSAAWEEYSEACIIYQLSTTGDFPTPEEITVPHYSYLLGLGDVPGELRRQALDALRVGDLDLAESRLVMMEHIYLNLVSMDETPLLKGLRRKMDIARGVIERTRSEVTAEVGRRRLNESVERLYERLGDKP